MSPVDRKNVVIFAPHQQGRWLVLAEQRPPLWIFSDVGAVVQKHLKLDFLVAGAVQQILNMPEVIWADCVGVLGAVGELPLRRINPWLSVGYAALRRTTTAMPAGPVLAFRRGNEGVIFKLTN